jgi:hypothetical protein
MRAPLLCEPAEHTYISKMQRPNIRARHRENAMSQSLRTPKKVAIRAVAAAALYASKLNGQQADESEARAPAGKKFPDIRKPAPKK